MLGELSLNDLEDRDLEPKSFVNIGNASLAFSLT